MRRLHWGRKRSYFASRGCKLARVEGAISAGGAPLPGLTRVKASDSSSLPTAKPTGMPFYKVTSSCDMLAT